MIADGDESDFHAYIAGISEDIAYLPLRALNLPACRPQTHQLSGPDGADRLLTVAADGITVVGAHPNLAAFGIENPDELRAAGRALLENGSTPLPVQPVDWSPR